MTERITGGINNATIELALIHDEDGLPSTNLEISMCNYSDAACVTNLNILCINSEFLSKLCKSLARLKDKMEIVECNRAKARGAINENN